MAESSKSSKSSLESHNITVFFDTESDNASGLRFTIKSNKLLPIFNEINGNDPDHILWIAVYRSPVEGNQEESLFHLFVVLETDRWYYSVEVTEKHVTVQRSLQLVSVRDMCQRQSRKKTLLSRIFGALGSGELDCLVRAYGKGTIRDVLEFLCEGSRLNAQFHSMLENDLLLAKWIFDLFNSDMKEFHYQKETTPELHRRGSIIGHENHHGSLCFHSDSDNHTYRIHHRDLLAKFDEINGMSPDHIVRIDLYQSPLVKNFFLVIHTEEGWFYSIDETWNITIQRSKQIESVRDKFLDGFRDYSQERRRLSLHERRRTTSSANSHDLPHLYATAEGIKTIRNVMAYLQRSGHLNVFFDVPLAQRLFKKFSAEGKVKTEKDT